MNRLKELRQEKKLTQQELAKVLEFPLRTYQRMENGESQIKPDKVEVLADYFGVTEGYLLGYTNNRFGVSQILKAIEEKMSNTDSALNKEVLESTMKIIELSDFLNMDLETLSNIYFYNLNRQKPMTVLGDLFDFFDSEARDYKELLSIVEPYQADEIIQEISKLGDYREELSSYLDRRKAEEDFFYATGYPVSFYETDEVEAEYEIKKQMSELDNDFIDFLKNHDIYLSDSEIEKVINIMYSYSNANDFYLSSLVRSKDLDKIQKEKDNNFSNLFKYSSFWKQNIESAEK